MGATVLWCHKYNECMVHFMCLFYVHDDSDYVDDDDDWRRWWSS